MTANHSESEIIVRAAVIDAIRSALSGIARDGLSGNYHIYISFRTRAAKISDQLLAQHPEEMTIVLQHMFWDLQVGTDQFQVTLSFSGRSEHLVIPFDAVTGFADTSTAIRLQPAESEAVGSDEEVEAQHPTEDETEDASDPENNVVAIGRFRRK